MFIIFHERYMLNLHENILKLAIFCWTHSLWHLLASCCYDESHFEVKVWQKLCCTNMIKISSNFAVRNLFLLVVFKGILSSKIFQHNLFISELRCGASTTILDEMKNFSLWFYNPLGRAQFPFLLHFFSACKTWYQCLYWRLDYFSTTISCWQPCLVIYFQLGHIWELLDYFQNYMKFYIFIHCFKWIYLSTRPWGINILYFRFPLCYIPFIRVK